MNTNKKASTKMTVEKVEIHFWKYATTKPPISTLSKNVNWSHMRRITCRPDLSNLSNGEKAKAYLVPRTEFSINERTKRP